jgi:GntR family transcriptional regulator/MocR family aminotransferase
MANTPARPPSRRLDVDFFPGQPDLASFPVTDWAWALGAAATAATALADYGDPAGALGLRSVLAGLGLVLAALAESGVPAGR